MSTAFKFGTPIKLWGLSADPSGMENGTMYYNTTTNKVRVYLDGTWADSSTGSVSLTGQALNQYEVVIGNASNLSAVSNTNSVGHILASVAGGLTIKNGVVTTAHLASGFALPLTNLVALNASIVPVTNASGYLTSSSVTSTELGYLSGVTSSIQTQINNISATIDFTPYVKKDGTVAMTGSLVPAIGPVVDLGVVNQNFRYVYMQALRIAESQTGTQVATLSSTGYASQNAITFQTTNNPNSGSITVLTGNGDPNTNSGAVTLQTGTVSGSGVRGKVIVNALSLDMSSSKIINVADPSSAQDASTKNYTDTQDALKLSLSGGSMTGNIAMNNNRITGLPAPIAANEPVRKADLEAYQAGNDFQPDVLGIKLASDAAPVSPVAGDRYILTTGTLAGSWGAISGFGNNDIVSYNGSAWVVAYDVSVQGPGALVWDRGTSTFQKWDGTNWTDYGGLSGITAGIGLTKTGNVLDVNLGAGITELPSDEIGVDVHTSGALMLTVDNSTSSTATGAQLSIKLADSSLAKNSSGLQIATGGIVDSHVNATANIALSKLASVTANKALASDASGKIISTTVTDTELGYLSGVTSAIQTQLNGKANQALSNLTATAINQSLLPVANGDMSTTGKALGSSGFAWNVVRSYVYRAANTTQLLNITTTSGSNVITVASNNGLIANGVTIYHATAFPNSATITNISGTTVTMSVNASDTVSASSAQVRFTGAFRSEDETTASIGSGQAILRSGNTTTGKSGDVFLKSGNASSGGTTGDVNIQSGTTSGTRGNIVAQSTYFIMDNFGLALMDSNNDVNNQVFLGAQKIAIGANLSAFTTIKSQFVQLSVGKSVTIHYEVVESTTGASRRGTLLVVINEVNNNIAQVDTYAETEVIGNGLEFNVIKNGGYLELQAKGTSTNIATMRAFYIFQSKL